MFICNIKLSKLFKIFFILVAILMLVFFAFGVYKFFSKASGYFNVSDKVDSPDTIEITASNYTNILQAVNDNIDSYVGLNIHFVGYVYRIIDFKETRICFS